MLVSTIISNGQSLADTPNTNFYTSTDALLSVNTAWKEMYSRLCEYNDDYFVTQLYIPFASLTADANRQFNYTYALPSDFYRLRLLQYLSDGPMYFPVAKMTIENFGNLQNGPGYRLIGTNLDIWTQVSYSTWCLWYYPAPLTLTTSTDLAYPTSMLPEILSYQVAIDIRMKQNLDVADKMGRRNELIAALLRQINRDDAKAEQPKNIFAQGFSPYI